MTSVQQNIIYQGNSIISVETLPDYSHPVVIKKPIKRHPSRRSLRSLEREYEMTRSLNAVDGRGCPQDLGATDIQVQLSKKDNTVYFMLKDNGIGFDLDSSTKRRGLGLASMEERARLIIGRGKCHAQN
jgi:hypothetical protein